MRGIFKSSIVRGLQQPLLYVGGLSTLVCAYEQALQVCCEPTCYGCRSLKLRTTGAMHHTARLRVWTCNVAVLDSPN